MASNDHADMDAAAVEPNASELIQVLKVLKKYNLKVSGQFRQICVPRLTPADSWCGTCGQDSEEILKRELNKKTTPNLVELISQGSTFR